MSDELTREQIEHVRDSIGPGDTFSGVNLHALCDMALRSLSNNAAAQGQELATADGRNLVCAPVERQEGGPEATSGWLEPAVPWGEARYWMPLPEAPRSEEEK